MDERRQYRGGLVWPIVLIGAGVIFLLNNMGILGWGVWETMFKLWPVLLIAVGLDILVARRSLLGSALVALLLVAVLGIAITTGAPRVQVAGAAVERTESISEDLKGISSADVEIHFGTGDLNLGALPASSPRLVEGTADLSRNEGLHKSYTATGGKGRLELISEFPWAFSRNLTNRDEKRWTLELNRETPIHLVLETGVGRSTIDLTHLTLTQLDVNGGVGEVNIKLPQRGRFDATIDGGVGEMTLVLPEGMAARIQVDGGLGKVDVDGEFERRGDEYISRDFSSAENRIEMTVDGGIGRIAIRQLSE